MGFTTKHFSFIFDREMSICATRKSKKHPNVYLRKDLENIARKRKIPLQTTRPLKKKELCELLGIPWVAPAIRIPTKTSKDILLLGTRPCNVMRSKARPTALTKEELVSLAVKSLEYSKTVAQRMTKEKLCSKLKKAGIKPSSKVKPAERREKIVTFEVPFLEEPSPFVETPGIPGKKKVHFEFPEEKPRAPKKKVSRKVSKRKVSKRKVSKRKVSEKPAKDCISRSKLKLNPHQKLLAKYLRTHRGAVAVHSVGSGKTLTAVAASQCVLDDHPDWNVLVVTPTSLQENFKKEMRAYGIDPNDARYTFMTLGKFANFYANKKCPSKTFLIVDEAHDLRTDIVAATRAAMTRARKSRKPPGMPKAAVVVKCAKNADKVLLLTATPVYNKPQDIINLVAMVNGTDALSISRFTKMIEENPGAFYQYAKCIFSFYDKPKTEDYPTVIEKEIKIIMNPEYYSKYHAIEKENIYLLRQTDPWVFLTGVRQATNAIEPCQKCQWAVNKIKEGQKTVLYSAFKTYGVKKIQGMLKNSGIKFAGVTGDMSIAEREKSVQEFNSSSPPNVLFITKAGGQGLDLKKVRNVILLESGWNRPGEEQVIGRAVRYKSHAGLPKSERKVNVYHLMIVKPSKRFEAEELGSADEILREKVEEKIKKNKLFENRLRALSIERLKECQT